MQNFSKNRSRVSGAGEGLEMVGLWTGGVLRFELDRGVLPEPQNPYPSLRVILDKKGTHF